MCARSAAVQSFASCGWKPTAANTSGSARASATAASLSGRSVPTVTIADSPAARARASTAARSVPKARSCRCAWLSIRPAVSPAVSPAAGCYAGCVAGCLPLRVGLRAHDPNRASSCSTIERSSFVNSGDGVPSGVPGVSACSDQPCSTTGVVAPRKSLSRSQLNGR